VTAPRVVVLDHGSGNLRSAERALARAGARVAVTPDLDAAAEADGLVVPGVGAFAAVMAGIDALGAAATIAARVAAGRPVLGICVGMQVLFEYGDEHGLVTKGLGVLPGAVTLLAAQRVPHMGWNIVSPPAGSRLFAGIPDGARFYFVHSYAARPAEGGGAGDQGAGDQSAGDQGAEGQGLVTLTDHGGPFVAAVERGPVWATQFHPEKSGDAGAVLLRNWVGRL
jgi:imidazole glycerol-phosphate synthase subunit HisH